MPWKKCPAVTPFSSSSSTPILYCPSWCPVWGDRRSSCSQQDMPRRQTVCQSKDEETQHFEPKYHLSVQETPFTAKAMLTLPPFCVLRDSIETNNVAQFSHDKQLKKVVVWETFRLLDNKKIPKGKWVCRCLFNQFVQSVCSISLLNQFGKNQSSADDRLRVLFLTTFPSPSCSSMWTAFYARDAINHFSLSVMIE